MWFGEPRALVCDSEQDCVASTNRAKKGESGPCSLISEKQSLFTIITAHPFLSPTAVNPDTTVHILSNTFPLKACKLLSLILFLPYLSIPLIHTMHSVIKSYVLY